MGVDLQLHFPLCNLPDEIIDQTGRALTADFHQIHADPDVALNQAFLGFLGLNELLILPDLSDHGRGLQGKRGGVFAPLGSFSLFHNSGLSAHFASQKTSSAPPDFVGTKTAMSIRGADRSPFSPAFVKAISRSTTFGSFLAILCTPLFSGPANRAAVLISSGKVSFDSYSVFTMSVGLISNSVP